MSAPRVSFALDEKFATGWRRLAGRYWSNEEATYREGEIDDWRVALRSVDATNANGAPALVTLAFKRDDCGGEVPGEKLDMRPLLPRASVPGETSNLAPQLATSAQEKLGASTATSG